MTALNSQGPTDADGPGTRGLIQGRVMQRTMNHAMESWFRACVIAKIVCGNNW